MEVQDAVGYAAKRASLLAAEKRFFDRAQPFMPGHFSVERRGAYHWDISAPETPGRASAWKAANPDGKTAAWDGQLERAFRIRGEPGNFVVFDERWDPHRPHPRAKLSFRTLSSAMLWIAEELMIPKALSND